MMITFDQDTWQEKLSTEREAQELINPQNIATSMMIMGGVMVERLGDEGAEPIYRLSIKDADGLPVRVEMNLLEMIRLVKMLMALSDNVAVNDG